MFAYVKVEDHLSIDHSHSLHSYDYFFYGAFYCHILHGSKKKGFDPKSMPVTVICVYQILSIDLPYNLFVRVGCLLSHTFIISNATGDMCARSTIAMAL